MVVAVKVKCQICGKKIPMYMQAVYTCKCKGVYCTDHKLNHDCTFDYKAEFREKAKERMPVIEAKKIEPIC